MEWFRWFHGAVSDPKWPLIARKSGVSVGVVVSVWAALLEHASQDEERGSVEDFDGETFDALYGYDDGVCDRVVSVMSERGLIEDGCIAAWQRRQLKDEGATERKRLQREREKLAQERAELEALRHEMSLINQDDTCDVTGCHEMSQPVTKCHLEQNRTEKKRKENTYTPSCTGDEDHACALDSPDCVQQKPSPVPPVQRMPEEPGVEFCELREFWDRECRPEGPQTGFIEYRQLKAAHKWPGNGRIAQDVQERQQSGSMRPGYAPSLTRYLAERWWEADIKAAVPARASPAQRPMSAAELRRQRENQNAIDVLRSRGAMDHGQHATNGNGAGSDICSLQPGATG